MATLSEPRRIHVVGAGGAGMSAIATVLAAMGHDVSGSDRVDSAVLARLGEAGVRTWAGHDPAGVSGVDLVAASTAVAADDPELVEARRSGIPVLRRAEVLAAICALRRTVAVAGTHGKTTTSAMLALLLDHAGWDPSYIVGGDLVGRGVGAQWGSGEWMVVEADESDGTFLELGADVAVVTNLEADHLEHYGDLDGLRRAFDLFVASAGVARVVGTDDAGSAAVAARLVASGVEVETFATSPGPATCEARRIVAGRSSVAFDVAWRGEVVGTADLGVPGEHNVRNALAALTTACALGVEPRVAIEGLSRFAGVGRRFEWRGERGGVTYVDDYGHLPGEVRAVLDAAADGGWDRVVAVFQPHRYSRTEALWRDFAGAFDRADVVVVTGIYSSGETPRPGVDGSLVASAVRGAGHGAVHYVEALADLPATLAALLRPGDLCLTLGAGDLTDVVARLVGAP